MYQKMLEMGINYGTGKNWAQNNFKYEPEMDIKLDNRKHQKSRTWTV